MNDQRRVITALGVPKICSELKNQTYQIAVEKYSFLQNLELSRQVHLNNPNIDLLTLSGRMARPTGHSMCLQRMHDPSHGSWIFMLFWRPIEADLVGYFEI